MPEVFDHFFALLGTTAAAELDLVRLEPAYRVYGEGETDPFDVVSGRESAVAAFDAVIAVQRGEDVVATQPEDGVVARPASQRVVERITRQERTRKYRHFAFPTNRRRRLARPNATSTGHSPLSPKELIVTINARTPRS
jgi:phytoene dehydrogenase-like protein